MKAMSIALLLGAALLPGVTCAASAANVRVSHAWLRILPGDLPAAGYATLQNLGKQPAALTGARSTRYADVMLHLSSGAGGTNRMHMVNTMPIPAQDTAQLAPGSYHLMLTKPAHPVTPGDHVPLTLTFADGSTLRTTFIARPANAIDAGEPESPASNSAATDGPTAHDHTHGGR